MKFDKNISSNRKGEIFIFFIFYVMLKSIVRLCLPAAITG